MNLGFAVGRRPASAPASPGPRETADHDAGLAETLRASVDPWVAVAGDEVLVAAASPHEVVRWLAQHRLKAASMFRVPEDDLAASGLAPL